MSFELIPAKQQVRHASESELQTFKELEGDASQLNRLGSSS